MTKYSVFYTMARNCGLFASTQIEEEADGFDSVLAQILSKVQDDEQLINVMISIMPDDENA